MKPIHLIAFVSAASLIFSSCKTAVIFTASEKDAQIYVDGRPLGSGKTSEVKVAKNTCVNVRVEKTGFMTETLDYCYAGPTLGQPNTKFIELPEDDAYNASITTDYANKDFEVTVNPEFTEEEAWKIISQIVTSYFDNLEMADLATGYMKTSWQSKSFERETVRTRVIVKQSGFEPLKYKIKIVSENSGESMTSVKSDDQFKEWDRILRGYGDLISEFQARLGVI